MKSFEQNVIKSFGLVKTDIATLAQTVADLKAELKKVQKELTSQKIEQVKQKARIKEVKQFKK
jgi:regulator of replication initiation timing